LFFSTHGRAAAMGAEKQKKEGILLATVYKQATPTGFEERALC